MNSVIVVVSLVYKVVDPFVGKELGHTVTVALADDLLFVVPGVEAVFEVLLFRGDTVDHFELFDDVFSGVHFVLLEDLSGRLVS